MFSLFVGQNYSSKVEQFCFGCSIAMAIALPSFAWQQGVLAQVRSNNSVESNQSFQNRLASPWSDAKLIYTLESTSTINAIEFSPDGKILAAVESEQISLWDTTNGKVLSILPHHYSAKYGLNIVPTAIAFSPDSRFLATVTWSQGALSPDESIIVRDTTTGDKILGLNESTGCRRVVFDPAGDILYAACDLGVTAWSFPKGEKLFGFDLEYPVDAIALSHDGKTMATADANITGGRQGEKSHQIQLWKLDGDRSTLLNTLDGHTNDIAQIEFTADDRQLVSSSYDGKIRVWNWQEGEINRKTNNLYSSNGLFSLSEDSRLIAGNFYSSAMTSLVTGLPIRNVLTGLDRKQTQMLTFSPQGQLFAGVKSTDSDRSQIYLWYNGDESHRQISAIEDEYLSIDLAKYWHDNRSVEASDRNTKPSQIGKVPQEIAVAALGLSERIESEAETVTIDYPQDDLAIVTIVQTNLLDDSIAGIRYRVKFAPYGDRSQKLWQVVWAGRQFKCYRARDRQDWSKDLCK